MQIIYYDKVHELSFVLSIALYFVSASQQFVFLHQHFISRFYSISSLLLFSLTNLLSRSNFTNKVYRNLINNRTYIHFFHVFILYSYLKSNSSLHSAIIRRALKLQASICTFIRIKYLDPLVEFVQKSQTTIVSCKISFNIFDRCDHHSDNLTFIQNFLNNLFRALQSNDIQKSTN